jgi:hypothetical protein
MNRPGRIVNPCPLTRARVVFGGPDELIGELPVAVEDREPLPSQEAVDRVGQVAGDLGHERRVEAGRDAGELDGARRVIDDEERVVPHKPARGHDPGAADALARIRPLRGDQATVPTQDGVGSGERRDARKEPASEGPALRGEAAALVVGEPSPPAAELLLQDAVLLDQVGDGRGLLAVDPASEGRQRGLEGAGFPARGATVSLQRKCLTCLQA